MKRDLNRQLGLCLFVLGLFPLFACQVDEGSGPSLESLDSQPESEMASGLVEEDSAYRPPGYADIDIDDFPGSLDGPIDVVGFEPAVICPDGSTRDCQDPRDETDWVCFDVDDPFGGTIEECIDLNAPTCDWDDDVWRATLLVDIDIENVGGDISIWGSDTVRADLAVQKSANCGRWKVRGTGSADVEGYSINWKLEGDGDYSAGSGPLTLNVDMDLTAFPGCSLSLRGFHLVGQNSLETTYVEGTYNATSSNPVYSCGFKWAGDAYLLIQGPL